jgi:hypothetical protein
MILKVGTGFRTDVIPGRDEIANPESSRKDKARGRIPGPAHGRSGMTLRY